MIAVCAYNFSLSTDNFTPLARSQIVAQQVTSEPVPEVVGIPIHGTIF